MNSLGEDVNCRVSTIVRNSTQQTTQMTQTGLSVLRYVITWAGIARSSELPAVGLRPGLQG